MAGVPRNITFFIDKLPPLSTRHDHQNNPINAYSWEHVAAVYQPVLKGILGSRLNMAGKIDSIYVNFESQGWFLILPQAAGTFEDVTQQGFERMMAEVFTHDRIIHPDTHDQIWSRVNNITEVVSGFPANTQFIGCLSGRAGRNSVSYTEYIQTLQADRTYAFVFGDFTTGDMLGSIHEAVTVSEYLLRTEIAVYQICIQLENRFNIH